MRILRRLREQRGYTMLELLIAMAILGTIVGAITTLFIQASNAEFDMNRRFQAQQAARVAIDRMRREIHCASAITPTGASSSITVTLPAGCPTAGGVQTNITYDTSLVSAGRYKLRRNSVMLADYSTQQNAFSYTAPVTGVSLGKLTVTLPINTKPSDTGKQWKLVADIVLRNTSR
ncbi:MAG TPA: type II secretion system protein [Gaiellaceae bacterium]|jgi:prepilin-type N-terminal cleavage/methylation domain-containing protein